jgi:hypothetical protein
MGIQGTAAFGEIYAALGPLGIAVGALILPLVAVSKAIKKLVDTAVRQFKRITKEAFEAGKQFETTEAAFKAIFKIADTGVVEAALYSARMESERLGVALEEILPRILPKVSSLEEAYKIAELIPGLAASAIDLGPADALRSIIEALAGDLISLRKAFEIDVSGIRKAQEEFGLVQGLITSRDCDVNDRGSCDQRLYRALHLHRDPTHRRWDGNRSCGAAEADRWFGSGNWNLVGETTGCFQAVVEIFHSIGIRLSPRNRQPIWGLELQNRYVECQAKNGSADPGPGSLTWKFTETPSLA